MKKLFLLAISTLLCFCLNAQVKTPSASPKCKMTQTVGLTDISLEYSRPGVKDRVIFGDLVPFGEKWRTGANRNTIVTFSTDVIFGGTAVEKGSYALYSTPGADTWEVYLYKSTDNGGLPDEWDDAMVAATVSVKSFKMDEKVETMMIDVNNIRNAEATLDLVWESTYISIPVEVPADDMVMANIDKVMAGPSGRDYYNSAVYYKDSGKDLTTALDWMNKALEMEGEKFWMVRQKGLLLAEMGKKDEAIKAIKRSTELAIEADYQPYVKMNNKTLAEWGM